MKRSTYILLIKHANHCLQCTRWLLGSDNETLCAHGRHILQHESFKTSPLQPVPELGESEAEFLRRTR
jgi:hypothetical protein